MKLAAAPDVIFTKFLYLVGGGSIVALVVMFTIIVWHTFVVQDILKSACVAFLVGILFVTQILTSACVAFLVGILFVTQILTSACVAFLVGILFVTQILTVLRAFTIQSATIEFDPRSAAVWMALFEMTFHLATTFNMVSFIIGAALNEEWLNLVFITIGFSLSTRSLDRYCYRA